MGWRDDKETTTRYLANTCVVSERERARRTNKQYLRVRLARCGCASLEHRSSLLYQAKEFAPFAPAPNFPERLASQLL